MEPVFFEKNRPPFSVDRRGLPARIYPLLFDLKNDPSETTDLSRTRPERRGGAVERLGSGEEPGNHKNMFDSVCVYIYICVCVYTHICIYRLDVKVCFPTWWGPLDFIRAACRLLVLILHINISISQPDHNQIISRSQPDHKKIISRSQSDRIWF